MASIPLYFECNPADLIRSGFNPVKGVDLSVEIPDDPAQRELLARVWEQGKELMPDYSIRRNAQLLVGSQHIAATLRATAWPPTQADVWAALDRMVAEASRYEAEVARHTAAGEERIRAASREKAEAERIEAERRAAWQAWLATDALGQAREPDPARVPLRVPPRPSFRDLADAGMIDLPSHLVDVYLPDSWLTEAQRRAFAAAGMRLHHAVIRRLCDPLLRVLPERDHDRYLAGAMPDAEVRPYVEAAHRARLDSLVGDMVAQAGLTWETARSGSATSATSATLWELDAALGEESAHTVYRIVEGHYALRHHYRLPTRSGGTVDSWLDCVDRTDGLPEPDSESEEEDPESED